MRRARIRSLLTSAALLIGMTWPHAQGQSSSSAARIVVGPNIRASANTATGGRNECWITASPKNPDFLIGVSQSSIDSSSTTTATGPRRCATMISRNGGQTWREVTLPGQEEGCFDPMTAAAADGRIYVMHTMIGRNMGRDIAGATERREGSIRIWSTTDEGRTWKGPAELHCPLAPDHPRMIVDTSGGPHHGRLYVAWNEVSDTLLKKKYHIFLHTSDDEGQTFSDPMLLATDDGGKLVITEPVVLSDGTLLVTYYQYFWPLSDPKNDRQPLFILRSTDGGKTFGEPEKVLEVGSSGWRHLRREFGRAFTLPIIVADTSASSRFRDRMYAVWDDVNAGESNIWFVWSGDKGKTWSKPKRLNDNPPPADGAPPDFRMTPVVAVNDDGVVAVAWYDRRDDPTRRCWHQYFTASLDGGETFRANAPISSAASCPEKDLAPSAYVWNIGPELDDTLPTNEELAGGKTMEHRQLEEEVGTARAFRQIARGATAARVRVSFDRGRNVWPGHYTGLTAGPDRAFHALWADRRNKMQQLFWTRVEVKTDSEPPTPATKETVVTDIVQVIGGPGKYDETKGTATVELQIRNVSDRTIYAPLKLRVAKIVATPAGPTATFVETDGGGTGVGAFWDFSKLLGTRARLDPKQASEAKTITIKARPEVGLDGVFEFEVLGHVERDAPTSVGREGGDR